jgi:hypothetical protein
MTTYTIKIKSKEALIQARNENPQAGVFDDADLDLYADKIYTNCRSTDDKNPMTLYPGGFDHGRGIIIKEEIEWVKAE